MLRSGRADMPESPDRSRMKVLYVGPDYRGSNGTCWRDAFRALGCDVRTLDSEKLLAWPASLAERIAARFGGQPRSSRVGRFNAVVAAAAEEFRPRVTFFVQARHVQSETIERVAQSGTTVVYYNDDMFNPANRTGTFLSTIRAAECLVTTKSFNVVEFERAGARKVLYQPNAFDPAIHFPARPSAAEAAELGGDVTFIGTFRPARADFLADVIGRLDGLLFNLWGGGWSKMLRPLYWHRAIRWARVRRRLRGRELWGEDMGKAIQANKVALGLLNHANRDLHTSRTFEIPACGGFMLAERTLEHCEYFEEDREAVYFASIEELVDKARYYVAHDSERTRIAARGYERCVHGGHRYSDRARSLTESLGLSPR